eukprot:CAMPEP_0172307718 /NCGR_PEP_ID=MMETSP1058-20130122/8511_1 /TAXON_ID=83371 /ORGANISM="Detonula confervacea, Strain CCMP 353" /LENGTH=315 /DNA_ID=CAMNT_0013019957 /DNA_START=101 /DNA_END=1048 /DNA_ORIENTATION=-
MSNDEGGCRFGWHPRTSAFFITAGLGLSIMSSLDCKFLEVDLSFIPQNYYSDSLGFGLWTYAAPDGRCLTYTESRQSGGFSDGANIYSNLFINNDINWSISRVLAVVGIIFGLGSLISIWINVFKSEPHLVDILAYTTITAGISECAKFGLFLGTDLCKSPDYWYNDESNEFSGSRDCQIDRGAFISISSIFAYFVSVILSVGFASRPKSDCYTYEEASLPSWMASEDGVSEKAQAPPVEDTDRRSSVGGQDWSRVSAPSTIPSGNFPVEEDYGLNEEALPKENENPQPMQAYPPANKVPRKYDDMSTLTWDVGY